MYMSNYNRPFNLPQTLTSIGENFLGGVNKMSSYVNVGNLSADIAVNSPNSFSAISTSSPAFATGISIKGAKRSEWLDYFPNSDVSPYRKLLDGGA